MSKKALVILANGLEEIEAITTIDILRRAGVQVTTAGLNDKKIHGSHDININADELLDNVMDEAFDLVALPGGMPGTKHLRNDDRVLKLIKRTYEEGNLIGAVCASPSVLFDADILENKIFTIHPGEKSYVGGNITDDRVTVDGRIITGQASGSAMEYAFKLVEKLFDKDKVHEVNKGVIAKLD